ncbi:hypothetical protein O6H91_Y441400 [Diphasiastrum complanatum]|nr:hypothetical protein O6H91_Y441400 [Diphasiastrum complanatum]
MRGCDLEPLPLPLPLALPLPLPLLLPLGLPGPCWAAAPSACDATTSGFTYRGLLASKEDVSAADNAARTLEAAGGAVEFPDELEKLQGKWRLIYSSAFASGNLGGTRPGPPAGQFPLTLGQVFQRIDTLSQELDNIVDLRFNLFWPLPVLEVTATLAHKFELTGKTGIRIIFEKTRLKAGGNLSELPPVDLPKLPEFLRPSSNSRSGQFEVTFLDEDFRITRGDRGELRIFVKL